MTFCLCTGLLEWCPLQLTRYLKPSINIIIIIIITGNKVYSNNSVELLFFFFFSLVEEAGGWQEKDQSPYKNKRWTTQESKTASCAVEDPQCQLGCPVMQCAENGGTE